MHHDDTSSCIMMTYHDASCSSWRIMMTYIMTISRCIVMIDSSWCIMLTHHDASWWLIMMNYDDPSSCNDDTSSCIDHDHRARVLIFITLFKHTHRTSNSRQQIIVVQCMHRLQGRSRKNEGEHFVWRFRHRCGQDLQEPHTWLWSPTPTPAHRNKLSHVILGCPVGHLMS